MQKEKAVENSADAGAAASWECKEYAIIPRIAERYIFFGLVSGLGFLFKPCF